MKAIRPILYIALLNLAMAFIFQFGRPITRETVLIDAAICAVITVIICYVLIARAIRKQSEIKPRHPISFVLLLTGISTIFMVAFSSLIIWMFKIEQYSFPAFAVWKMVYATLLSLMLQKLIIWYIIKNPAPAPRD